MAATRTAQARTRATRRGKRQPRTTPPWTTRPWTTPANDAPANDATANDATAQDAYTRDALPEVSAADAVADSIEDAADASVGDAWAGGQDAADGGDGGAEARRQPRKVAGDGGPSCAGMLEWRLGGNVRQGNWRRDLSARQNHAFGVELPTELDSTFNRSESFALPLHPGPA